MREMTRLLCGVLALALVAVPAIAQQGEGTAADFEMTTGVDLGTATLDDKYATVGSALEVNISSPGATFAGAGIMLTGDVSPVSFDIEEFGAIGTGINRFVILDGINGAAGPSVPAAGVPFTANFVIPAGSFWDNGGGFNTNGLVADDWGLFLQAFCESPTGLFGLIEVSETIKHEVDTTDLWRDDCAGAVTNVAGLSDADVGNVISVNTGLFSNTTETGGTVGFGTQTGWTLEAPGAGTRQQAPEAFVTFEATAGGIYTFSLCNSSYDTTIYQIADDCVTPGFINDDHDNGQCVGVGSAPSSLTLCIAPGTTFVLAIDGFGATSSGRAEMTISQITDTTVVSQDINSGDLAGGEVVTFGGCSLDSVTSVTFNGVAATGVSSTFTSLTATAPAGMAGTVDIAFDGVVVGSWTYVDNSGPSFSECSTPALAIPDNDLVGTSDTLNVAAGTGATILAGSVTVDLDISHTWVGDLLIDLTSPAGTTVNLWANATGDNDDLIGTLPTVFFGQAAPGGAGDFSEFDAEDPNGVWTLFASDSAGGDTGTINEWCVNGGLEFAAVAESSSPALAIPDNDLVGTSDVLNVVGDTTIGSLTVDLDISHTWVGDLLIDLTSPAATTLNLWANATGDNDDLIGNLPTNFFGQDAPGGMGDFSEFAGETTAGNWTLFASDSAGGDTGTINSWGINAN